jgi:hypothetical protein
MTPCMEEGTLPGNSLRLPDHGSAVVLIMSSPGQTVCVIHRFAYFCLCELEPLEVSSCNTSVFCLSGWISFSPVCILPIRL